jgi:dTDP-4-amino-4,6-dideoxygalactose transaminase
MKVPFADLSARYESLKPEIDAAIARVIAETAFISGSYATTFEKEFAGLTGAGNVVACANGTDSLEILLEAMGIGAGDEVIVPALSWISTGEAVSRVGATPVFVDIDEYFLINPDLIEEKVTPRTKAIIPVHLYGQPTDMKRILEIAHRHGLRVMEDCAQAHAARFEGQQIGSFGDCASFSFYPGKNLGAFGDAGAMTTNDEALARTARRIANHGQEGKHNHLMEGRNSRMDGIHAAVLSACLPKLPEWTRSRQRLAERYQELLADTPLTLPLTAPDREHVWHLYVVRTNRRDELARFLSDHDISTAVHYPTPMPLMPAYARFEFTPADFPVASAACGEILSLPMFPEMTNEQQDHVCQTIHCFFA